MADNANNINLTREEARSVGAKRYFSGKACPRGHVAERYATNTMCCECLRENRKKLQIERPELLRAYRKKYTDAHPDRHAASIKKHRTEHRDRVRARCANWKKDNPEKMRKMERALYSKKAVERAAQAREWRRQNTDKQKATRKRAYEKRKQNPHYRLDDAIRANIVRGLDEGTKNRNKAYDLLGYSPERLRMHLEAQFKDGMCWQNYGEWHVDHIRPLCSFEYATPQDEQFKRAWSIDNLQPLWAIENHRKGGRFEG